MNNKSNRQKNPASASRRKFVKQLGGGAALAAATGLGNAACQTAGGKVNWSATFDWISIGSGLAGCAAAIFGHDKGFNTLLLEKADKIGGLTTQSGGTLWVPMNPWMKSAGIADSREEAISYLRYISGGYGRQEYIEAFVDNVNRAIGYLQEKADFKLTGGTGPDFYRTPGAKERGRRLVPERFPSETLEAWRDKVLPSPYYQGFPTRSGGDGSEGGASPARSAPQRLEPWRKVLGAKLDEILKDDADYRVAGAALGAYAFRGVIQRGIEVRTGTKVDKLVLEGDRVAGVLVTHDGQEEYIRANRGVVLATGGFHSRILPGYGVAWTLATEAGAALHSEPITVPQIYVQVPGEEFQIGAPAGRSNYELRMPHSLVVNRFGERFGNEAFFQDIGSKICHFDNFGEHRFVNIPLYLIFDHALVEANGFGGLPPGYAEGLDWVSQGKTLGDLAAQMKLPAAKLEAAVRRFNELARRGNDTDFGRSAATLGPLEKPPFYGVELTTVDPFLTVSRVVINTQGQVLGWRDEKPIPGFYACGGITATGLVWGIGYQGGSDLAAGATFALLAAEHAAGVKA
jgi:glycine/D-amino acid oxidase-like deaminating enzyme